MAAELNEWGILYAAWWRVASNVSRSAAVAAAIGKLSGGRAINEPHALARSA
jgi:hypothetical protein